MGSNTRANPNDQHTLRSEVECLTDGGELVHGAITEVLPFDSYDRERKRKRTRGQYVCKTNLGRPAYPACAPPWLL